MCRMVAFSQNVRPAARQTFRAASAIQPVAYHRSFSSFRRSLAGILLRKCAIVPAVTESLPMWRSAWKTMALAGLPKITHTGLSARNGRR
ncbi:MAG: hypothetical protein FD189_2588 [Elusimicrobia bacterium]|nr:MAG: hypothetical protein FD189_2588 [Elusimicrobiota bacterium]